jgi:hypothetical protein
MPPKKRPQGPGGGNLFCGAAFEREAGSRPSRAAGAAAGADLTTSRAVGRSKREPRLVAWWMERLREKP